MLKYQSRAGLVTCVASSLAAVALACLTLTGSSQQPAPTGGDPAFPQSSNLVVKIDAKGNYILGQTPVTIDQLRTNLMAESAKQPKVRLKIQADKSAPLKAIVKVMDLTKEPGIGGVMLHTSERKTVPVIAPGSNERPRTIEYDKYTIITAAAALQRFNGQTDVRPISQETNGIFSAYDREIAGAVGRRWRELLAERAAAGPPVSVMLEFQAHPGGQVTNLRAVQTPGGEVFALLAQKAVLDVAPLPNWSGDMRRAHTNDYRILRLSFTFQEKAK
jgi:biopolymer transport protein ExbD